MQEQLSRLDTPISIPSADETTVRFPIPPANLGTGFFEIRTDLSEPVEDKSRISKNGNETAVLVANADLLIRHGEGDLALHLLRQCLYLNSHHSEALKRLSSCLNKREELGLKTKVFETLVQSDLCFETMAGLAHCYYLGGDDQKARETYFEALKLLTDESKGLFEVYKNLGNIFLREGDFDSAEEFYNKAFTLDSQSDVLLVNLGTMALQQQSHDQAVERFREALQINPRNGKAWVGLALVHNAVGDHVLARANLENALDADSSNRTAVHLAASWAVRDQDFSFAIEALQDYVSQVDQDEEMSLLLIHLLCLRSQFLEARLELERLLLWDPSNEKLLQIEQEIRNAK
jgi:tetratricopeptide (TPR) repeat protein